MSIEDLIKKTIADALRSKLDQQDERLERLENLLLVLAECCIVPQEKAASVAGIHRNTIRSRVKSGQIKPLSTDTSKRNYFTAMQIEGLKPKHRRIKQVGISRTPKAKESAK